MVTSLALAFFACGCTSIDQSSLGLYGKNPDLMVVEWNEWKDSEHHTHTVRSDEADVMIQVRRWLARITPRQPPRNSIGSVIPKVTVTYYYYNDRERKRNAEVFDVYRFQGSTDTVELLSESEIEELRHIVQKP